MSWDQFKKSREESKKNDLFVSLKDGDSATGCFVGDPKIFYKNFASKQESDNWIKGFSFRFKINFVVKEGSEYKSKIFEATSRVRDALLDAVNEYTQQCVFKIKRAGSGKEDTRYSILFQSKLSDEQWKRILETEPASLERTEKTYKAPKSYTEPEYSGEQESFPEAEEIPF